MGVPFQAGQQQGCHVERMPVALNVTYARGHGMNSQEWCRSLDPCLGGGDDAFDTTILRSLTLRFFGSMAYKRRREVSL